VTQLSLRVIEKSIAFIYQKNDLEFVIVTNMQFDSYSTDVSILVCEFCSKGCHLSIGAFLFFLKPA